MKPAFIDELEETFQCNQHAILHFNTADRFFWPERKVGPVYLHYFMAQLYDDIGYRVAHYAPASGLIELNPRNEQNPNQRKVLNMSGQQEPAGVLNKIVSLLRDKQEKWLILIHYGEHLAPANSIGISASAVPGQIHATELLHMLSMDDSIATADSRAAIITYGDLPADLITRSNGYRMIQINLPCFEERLAFIEFLQERIAFADLDDDLATQGLANITSGMPLLEIEKLFRSASHSKSEITRDQVKIAKARSIRQLTGDLLEVSEPDDKLDQVAGLSHIKDFFEKLKVYLQNDQKGVPQSLLLNGVPGCGKSYIVNALANYLAWVLIQFRNVRGPYVGQSEQQLEHVIRVAEQFDHSIIFFDEIDQLLGQRGTGASGDSGTSERMLARIMSWMGSMKHRGKILFVGASNRPDLLDPAMVDRFRVSIPVLHPTKSDILELIPILMERFERHFSRNVSLTEAASLLAPLKPTGRSLQEIVIHAGLRADNEAGRIGTPIGMKHLTEAAADFLPSEDPLEIEFITLTSLSMCSANSFLPWMSMEGLRPDAEIPQELITDKIVDAKTGRLNKVELHIKLRDLKQARQYARAAR